MPPESDDVGCPTSGSADVEVGAAALRLRELGVLRDQAAACVSAQVRERDVLRNRKIEQQAGALAVLGHEKDAGADRVDGGRKVHLPSVEGDATSQGPVDTEQDPGEFRTPGADEARQSEDLAGAEVEVDLAARVSGRAHAP